MNRLRALAPITHVVQAKGVLYPGWETIAGFNVDSVALRYAENCRKAHGRSKYPLEYRVLALRNERIRSRSA